MRPEGDVYVLDNKNFAVRWINVRDETVSTLAWTGRPGYTGDGGPALEATFGSDLDEYFDRPLSMSLEEWLNVFIGDTLIHVVRMVDQATRVISSIAGRHEAVPGTKNDPGETDPLGSNLSMSLGPVYEPPGLMTTWGCRRDEMEPLGAAGSAIRSAQED